MELKPSLESSTLDELVDELKSRCRVLFLVIKPEKFNKLDYDWANYSKGPPDEMLGLSDRARHDFMRQLHELNDAEEQDSESDSEG